jgi:hypothetical protein
MYPIAENDPNQEAVVTPKIIKPRGRDTNHGIFFILVLCFFRLYI